MKFQLYDKMVAVDDRFIEIYEQFMEEPFSQVTAEYMAHSYECNRQVSEKEIASAIEQNIVEHLSIYKGAIAAISAIKKEQDLRGTKNERNQ